MTASATQLAVSCTGLPGLAPQVTQLVAQSFASRLFQRDATLWGPEAQAEASQRLAWVGLGRSSRPLVGEITALRAELEAAGLDHVVLAGMGGSSLAPEVMCAAAGVELTVLDSSDPDSVRAALRDRLDRTVLVVSSKSGGTVETDSQRRAYTEAFRSAGLDPAARIVVVTDPGSPLEATARAAGHRVILAEPQVGGRYSALTAFGLVPSGLAGVDITALLDDAELVTELLAADTDDNPGLVLGAALAGPAAPALTRDKLLLIPAGTPLLGFADWAEQLLAESTGKQCSGLLPVVLKDADAPELHPVAADCLPIHLVGEDFECAPDTEIEPGLFVAGSLGAQFLLWEVATVVAGRLLGINPFDQPDVELAKIAARRFLVADATQPADPERPTLVDAGVEVFGSPELLAGVQDLPGAISALLSTVSPESSARNYLAVMAYLQRGGQAELLTIRSALAARSGRPVTFGWGPRFLHSTGQYHKGGPKTGVYLQITGAPDADLPVPGQPFSFAELLAAQAAGDAQVLSDRGRPILRLHLTHRATGLARLLEVLP